MTKIHAITDEDEPARHTDDEARATPLSPPPAPAPAMWTTHPPGMTPRPPPLPD